MRNIVHASEEPCIASCVEAAAVRDVEAGQVEFVEVGGNKIARFNVVGTPATGPTIRPDTVAREICVCSTCRRAAMREQ